MSLFLYVITVEFPPGHSAWFTNKVSQRLPLLTDQQIDLSLPSLVC